MNWIKSKAFWGAVVTAVSQVWKAVRPDSPVPDILFGIGTATGIIGIRHAIEKASPNG